MNNEKKNYVKPEADLVVFDNEDVIVTSDFPVDDEQIG